MGGQTAVEWYAWLWLSPVPTIATFFVVFSLSSTALQHAGAGFDLVDAVSCAVAVLVSALWHLLLLIPIMDRRHPFVRWHGRQALLLAGLWTMAALALGIVEAPDYTAGNWDVLPAVFRRSIPLFALWLFGTLWGQRQAARGDCWLMRKAGQGAILADLRRTDAL